MKKNRLWFLFALLLSVAFVLAACGAAEEPAEEPADEGAAEEPVEEPADEGAAEEPAEGTEEAAVEDFSVAMVTDIGGIDDRSFNQSAWEGLQAFGEEFGLTEGEGYDYAQSSSDADYAPNLQSLARAGYDLIFGVGYLLADAVATAAEQNPETNFAIIDSVIEDVPNVASITFKEHQGSFLVGVVAAMKTETGQVGFVGGVDSPLINKFEAGFRAGVATVDPEIEVAVQYAESFADPAKGKTIASSMYNQGADVIYHASGATGNGVFSQAKDIVQNDPSEKVWVIGVDRDQFEEGAIGDTNVTLTSMVKRVDVAVQQVSEMAMNGEFPGGEVLEFGLEEDGIAIAATNEEAYTEEIATAVQEYEDMIINGEIEVPSTIEELEAYLESL